MFIRASVQSDKLDICNFETNSNSKVRHYTLVLYCSYITNESRGPRRAGWLLYNILIERVLTDSLTEQLRV